MEKFNFYRLTWKTCYGVPNKLPSRVRFYWLSLPLNEGQKSLTLHTQHSKETKQKHTKQNKKKTSAASMLHSGLTNFIIQSFPDPKIIQWHMTQNRTCRDRVIKSWTLKLRFIEFLIRYKEFELEPWGDLLKITLSKMERYQKSGASECGDFLFTFLHFLIPLHLSVPLTSWYCLLPYLNNMDENIKCIQ